MTCSTVVASASKALQLDTELKNKLDRECKKEKVRDKKLKTGGSFH